MGFLNSWNPEHEDPLKTEDNYVVNTVLTPCHVYVREIYFKQIFM